MAFTVPCAGPFTLCQRDVDPASMHSNAGFVATVHCPRQLDLGISQYSTTISCVLGRASVSDDLPQGVLLDLAERGMRNGIHEHHMVRVLIGRQTPLE